MTENDHKKDAAHTLNETPSHVAAQLPGATLLADDGEIYFLRVPLEAWIALPSNDRHRDTERHARKAHWEFVKRTTGSANAAVRLVVGTELNGRICKIDGHARAYLWQIGDLPPPEFVRAIVFRSQSREEVNALYATYDTQAAAESMYDRVTGAYREHRLQMQSDRLKAGMIVDALSIAMTGFAKSKDKSSSNEFDVYDAVGRFRQELQVIDGLNPPQNIFQTGIVSAALLCLAISMKHLAFFSQLALTGGKERSGLFDPVESMRRYVQSLKNGRTSWVKAAQEDLCARCISAALLFEEGEAAPNYWSAEPPEPVDLSSILQRIHQSGQTS